MKLSTKLLKEIIRQELKEFIYHFDPKGPELSDAPKTDPDKTPCDFPEKIPPCPTIPYNENDPDSW